MIRRLLLFLMWFVALPFLSLHEEEKRVYLVYKGDRGESLLYDFGMEVGSSVEVGRFGAQQLMTCVEVDSIYTSFGWLVIGNNRPDVQFDKKGIHSNVEYDTKLQSSDKHKREIEKNDPSARNKFYKLL